MGINIIAARSRNNVIGMDGRIPWKIKGEQAQFRELTEGNAVIMGRSTYEEIGRPLPRRLNIVVSGTKKFEGPNIMMASSLEDAINKARSLHYTEIFIAGGMRLYKEAIGIADKMYITEIDMDVSTEGATQVACFPSFCEGKFELMEHEWQNTHPRYRRTTYTRKSMI